MSKKRRQKPADERGYILMIVMILLVVLTSAGVYALRVSQSDIRSSAFMRRLEGASNAAEVGVTARLAEVMASSEDAGAALGGLSAVETGGWTATQGMAAPMPSGAPHYEQSDFARFLVAAQPMVAVEANPPAGIQVGAGGQLTMWRVDAYGVSRALDNDIAAGTAQRVSVGVSVWSRGGLSYNSN